VFNLHHVVSDVAPMLPLCRESRIRRAELARQTALADWSPNLILMYPSYECFAVGPSAGSQLHLEKLVRGIVDWAADADMRAVAFLYVPSPGGPVSPLARALATNGGE
jgi:hypothetical protein